MQFSLQLTSQCWKKSIVSCRRHVTRCNLGMQLEMSSIKKKLCNFCSLCCYGVVRKVAGRLQRVTSSLCNLSNNFFKLATIAQSKARLYFLEQLRGIFLSKILSFAALDCNCNMSSATCNGFLFPLLGDKLQEKLYDLKPA